MKREMHLTDYQRKMLEDIPTIVPQPAGVPNWARVRLPFLPVMSSFIATQREAYGMIMYHYWGVDVQEQPTDP